MESLHLFWSFYFSRILYDALGYERIVSPFDSFILSALVFTLVMCAIMTAMGLYERNFWNGKSDMLLRVGVSFMIGLFVMTAIYYLVPDLYLSRGTFSLAFGIAFVGIVLFRFIFFRVSSDARINRRLLVLGVGQQAARLEELQDKKNAGFSIVGYIQVHEDERPRVMGAVSYTHRCV